MASKKELEGIITDLRAANAIYKAGLETLQEKYNSLEKEYTRKVSQYIKIDTQLYQTKLQLLEVTDKLDEFLGYATEPYTDEEGFDA